MPILTLLFTLTAQAQPAELDTLDQGTWQLVALYADSVLAIQVLANSRGDTAHVYLVIPTGGRITRATVRDTLWHQSSLIENRRLTPNILAGIEAMKEDYTIIFDWENLHTDGVVIDSIRARLGQ